MIGHARVLRLFLALHRVDFRKQEEGLLGEAYALGLDPFAGDLILFIGRNKRKIKLLYADASGLWLAKKAFSQEAMKTKFHFFSDASIKSISHGDLAMLIDGAAYEKKRQVADWPKRS